MSHGARGGSHSQDATAGSVRVLSLRWNLCIDVVSSGRGRRDARERVWVLTEASLSRARLSMARPVLGFQKLEHRPWRPYQFYSPRAMRCLRSSSRADSLIVFDCVNLNGPQVGPALVCRHCVLDCLCSLILERSRLQHPFLFS